MSYYGAESAKVSGMQEGTLMSISLTLNGQDFILLNGGPLYSFTPAISFLVQCDSQNEIDRLWAALTEGGEEVQCGWLKDRYGVSWQIVPTILSRILQDKDPQKIERVMRVFLPMKKIDMHALERAYKEK